MLSWILDRIYEGSGHCRKNIGTLMDMLYAIFSSFVLKLGSQAFWLSISQAHDVKNINQRV